MEPYLGQEIPKLGFGLMRLPKQGEAIDIEETEKMVDAFLEAGFTYFDTAWAYAGSEEAIRKALVERYSRDSYLFANKLPAWRAKSKEEAEAMFETSLARTGVGYFDFYLLHNLGENRTRYFEEYGIWDFVKEKKEQGLIRHWGFSFHDKAQVLEEILLAHPDAEFVQLQINYADMENPSVESRKCYEVARKYGKPVIIMEPVKGGILAKLPPKAQEVLDSLGTEASTASWAVRYAASLEGIITVLSGMSNLEQMEDNLSYMKEFQPLTEQEKATVERTGEVLAAVPSVPCTACGYCMKNCPQNVAIYGSFQAMNLQLQFEDFVFSKRQYNVNTDGYGRAKASACVECGACEKVCPQHISIREELKKVAEMFEK